jgi:hypothetical protein
VKQNLQKFCQQIDTLYQMQAHIKDEKQFALITKKNKFGFRAVFALRKREIDTTWDYYCLPTSLRDIKTTRELESHLYPNNAKVSATYVQPLYYKDQNKES